MPFATLQPPKPSIPITTTPLTPSSFSPFGTVIQNPQLLSSSSVVNQGTAKKYPKISPFTSHTTPSHIPSTANVNLFVCAPRTLEKGRIFRVNILERHPYTTQTFIPMGVDGEDAAIYGGRRYLVIVAPSLPGPKNAKPVEEKTPENMELKDRIASWLPPFPRRLRRRANVFSPQARPPPFPVPEKPLVEEKSNGRGLPDLTRLQAFVCNGSQAVTYGVGTWHAPMVALGDREIDFVVLVHENGSGTGAEGGKGGEDTEEVIVEGDGVVVDVLSGKASLKARL